MPDACGISSRRCKSFNSASALERFCTWRNTVASSITVVSILTGIGGIPVQPKNPVFGRFLDGMCRKSKHDLSISRWELNGEMIGHAGNYDMNFS